MTNPFRFHIREGFGVIADREDQTMFPSTATMALGLAITAALAVVDWYVWRTAPVLPYPRVASAPQGADAVL